MPSKQAKAPISAHPLFPAVVAVWFAALFGLGSGVLPNVLFERAITATGLASLIPAATPPLGATFRILLSLTFALAGAALGFVLARRLAAAQYVERPASPVSRLAPRPDPAPRVDTRRRPISVKDELDDDTRLDPVKEEDDEPYSPPMAQPVPGRRRSLALAEEERKSDFFTHRALPVAEEPAPQPAGPREEPMEQPLDLTSFASAEPVEDPIYVPQVEPRVEPESIVDRGLQGLRNRSPFAKPFGDEDEEPLDFAPPFAAHEETPLADEALPFSAPSQAVQPGPQIVEPAAQAAPEPEPEAEPVQVFQPSAPAPEPEPTPEPTQVFAAAAAAPAQVLPTDPAAQLDDLGMVQLAERLAASLRNRLSRPASTPAFVAGLKADFGIETDEVPDDIAPGSAIFGGAAFEPVAPDAPPPPPVIPAALRPLPYGFDEDEDDDGPIPSLSLPLAGFTAPAADDDEEAEELGEAEENYSSLLAMKNPFHAPAEFVRVEEPEHDGEIEPAVVFPAADSAAPSFAAPGTPPAPVEAEPEPISGARPFDAPAAATAQRAKPNPEETERALRSALATLQKMSGAA